jgi:hypothetical protein
VAFEARTAPVEDATALVDAWVCDLGRMTEPQIVGVPVPVGAAAGEAVSDEVPAGDAGTCVLWREVLLDADGRELAAGEWGDPTETVFVKAPPEVATEAVALVVDAGSAAQDRGAWTGAPAGSTVEFEYRTAPVEDASLPVDEWVCDLDQAGEPAPAGGPWPTDAHEGTRLSDEMTTGEAGVCFLFKEILRDRDGEILAEGVWGDPSETVYVKAPPAVTTQVVALVVEAGSAAQDQGAWTGAPAGATVGFEHRTAPVEDTSLPVEDWVCVDGHVIGPPCVT